MKRIEGTSYVDAEHIGKSVKAIGRSRKCRYVHTCPDDVLEFLKHYLSEHGPSFQMKQRKEYHGLEFRVQIGLAFLVKSGRIRVVGLGAQISGR